MNSFSLPRKFYERIACLHAKLAGKVFRAVFEYMYSDGTDTAIDKLIIMSDRQLVADFKAYAAKRLAAREKARERRLMRKNLDKRDREAKVTTNERTRCHNGLTVGEMRTRLFNQIHDDRIIALPACRVHECFNLVFCRVVHRDFQHDIFIRYIESCA